MSVCQKVPGNLYIFWIFNFSKAFGGQSWNSGERCLSVSNSRFHHVSSLLPLKMVLILSFISLIISPAYNLILSCVSESAPQETRFSDTSNISMGKMSVLLICDTIYLYPISIWFWQIQFWNIKCLSSKNSICLHNMG